MKIIVAGCGKIGKEIISSLCEEKNDVTIMDIDASVVDTLSNIYDVIGVVGSCADPNTLLEAGADKCDLYLSVTESDELNIMSCFLAKNMGASQTIARIRKPEYNYTNLDYFKNTFDLSLVINPEYAAAKEIFNILKFPSAVKIETFSRRNFEMMELLLKEDSVLCGMTLAEMRSKYDADFLVCVVKRGKEVIIPDGSFRLEAGDKIGISAKHSELSKIMKMIGNMRRQARDIMIMGGSRTGFYLARMLDQLGNTVKIIDCDPKKCEELAAKLPKAVIICGDATDQDLLLEEGIANCDAVVSLTGMDEENILISIFADSEKVPTTIAKINRRELVDMADKLGVKSIISPKKIVSTIVLRYARALNNSAGSKIETLYKLFENSAEATEFIVSEDAKKVIGIRLREMKTKKNVIIAGIIRNGRPIIPSGEEMILADDRVVLISANCIINDITDILA